MSRTFGCADARVREGGRDVVKGSGGRAARTAAQQCDSVMIIERRASTASSTLSMLAITSDGGEGGICARELVEVLVLELRGDFLLEDRVGSLRGLPLCACSRTELER